MRVRLTYNRRGEVVRYEIDGVEVSAEEYAARQPRKRKIGVPLQGSTPSCWPMRSRALAVHPRQVEQANARNKRMGSNVRYDRDGTAIIPDRGERKRLLRVEAFHDNDGGYGD